LSPSNREPLRSVAYAINYTAAAAASSTSAGLHNPQAIQHADGRVFVFADGVPERPNANLSR
jgi:hypothetical protein